MSLANIGTLEGLIKLRDEFTSKLNKAVSEIDQAGKKLESLGKGASDLGSALTRTVTLPLVAMAGASVKSAIQFESSFAGVIKTVDGLVDEFNNLTAEGQKLQDQLRDLAAGENAVPIDVNELNAIAEAAGQLGIARGDIVQFTKTMADLANTTNLTSDEAATMAAQFQNIFGAAGKEVDRFGSTLVALGNAGASTEKDIISMGLRIAGAGVQIGLSQGEVLAVASALSSLGIEAEAGGSAISKVMIDMASSVNAGSKEAIKQLENYAAVSGMTAKAFQSAFSEDAAGALNSFIVGLGKLKDAGGNVLGTLEQMGITEIRMRDALLRASGAGNLLTDSLNLQSKAWQENSALTAEAEKRYQTFESQLKIFWNQFKDVAITFGTALLPVLRDTLTAMKPVIELAAEGAKHFASLSSATKASVLAIGGIAAAMGPVLFVTGQLLQSWGIILQQAPRVAAAIRMAFAPTLVVAGITTMLLWINDLITKWGEAETAAMRYQLRAAEASGKAIQAYQGLVSALKSSPGGTVSESFFNSAVADAERLKATIVETQEQIDKFYRDTAGGVGLDPSLRNAGPVAIKPEDLKEAEASLEQLMGVYKQLMPTLSNAKVATQELATEQKDQIITLQNLSDEQQKALDQINKSIEGYRISAEQAERLREAAIKGANAHRDLSIAIEAENVVRDLQQQLIEQGLSLSPKQIAALNSYIERTAVATRETEAMLRAQEALARASVPVSVLDNSADQGMKDLLKDLEKSQELTESIASEEDRRAQAIAEATRLYNQGLINAATYQRILIENADKFNVELSKSQLYWQRIQEQVNRLADDITYNISNAFVDVLFEGSKAFDNFWDSIKASLKSTLKEMIADWLNKWIRAMAEWLVRWAATQATAKSISVASGGGIYGNGGGGDVWGAAAGAGAKYAAGGGGMSANSLAGYASVAYALFVVYKGFIEDHDKKFARVSIINGQVGSIAFHGSKYLDGISEAAHSILKSLEDFAQQFNLDMERFGSISIQSSADGWFVGLLNSGGQAFETMEEAIAYAQVMMLKFGEFSDSVSRMVQAAIKGTKAMTPEELISDINFARELENQNKPDIAQMMQEDLDRAIAQWRRVKELFLSYFSVDLPAFAEGVNSILTKLQSGLQSQYNQLKGIEEDPKQAWERQRIAFNQQRALVLLQLKLWRAEIDQRILNYKVNQQWLGGLGGVTRNTIKFTAAMVQAGEAMDPVLQQLLDIQAQIDKALNEIPPEITEGEYPGKKGGGKGRGSKDAARDFIDNKEFELSLHGLSDYMKAIKELDRVYEEQLKQAGKDKALREELLALKERELAILEQEKIQSTVEKFREFLGLTNQFDRVRETAADLIKEINESPFGSERKARMIERVLDNVENQIARMAQQSAVSLFGQMLADMEKFGATDTEQQKIRRAMAILEHQLKLAHYRTEIGILKAQGVLSLETLNLLEGALKFLEGIDPTKFLDPSSTPSGDLYNKKRDDIAKAQEEYVKKMKSAIDLLEKYKSSGMDPLTRALKQINDDFTQIREALGNTPEVLTAFNNAIRDAFEQALSGIRDFYNGLRSGEQSNLTTAQRYMAAMSNYNRILAEVQSGDYSELSDLAGAGQTYIDLLAQMYGTSTQGFEGIRQQVLAQLEALLELGNGVEDDDPNQGIAPNPQALNNLLQFPQLLNNTSEGTRATRDLTKVVDTHGQRNEEWLSAVAMKLDNLSAAVDDLSRNRDIGYGNGN